MREGEEPARERGGWSRAVVHAGRAFQGGVCGGERAMLQQEGGGGSQAHTASSSNASAPAMHPCKMRLAIVFSVCPHGYVSRTMPG